MKIALDAMGGDNAPDVVIDGVAQALLQYQKIDSIVLVGNKEKIQNLLEKYSIAQHPKIQIEGAEQVVEMSESSMTPLRTKKDSSISICLKLAKEGKVDAVVSAGHTGACVACSVVRLRTLEGIHRPAIGTIMPTRKGFVLLIDAGANIESKPEHLVQFAQMGNTYLRNIFQVKNPRVGLLSIGEEDSKGNELTKEAFENLKKAPVNFIGNVEGSDLFRGDVDVVVCDGFVGNVLLKSAESCSRYLFKIIKERITKNLFRKIGAFFLKGVFKELQKIASYDEYGGAPLLGINGTVIISHGSSSAKAIKNAVRVAVEAVEQEINQKIEQAIKEK